MKKPNVSDIVATREPVHPATFRGFARQISSQCVNRKVVEELERVFFAEQNSIKSKKGRRKAIRMLNKGVDGSVCASRTHAQFIRSSWLILVSEGDGAIDLVELSVTMKPSEVCQFVAKKVVSLTKHSVERIVERWRVRMLSQLISVIEHAFGWLRLANRLMSPSGHLLIPLPDGFLCLRRSPGEVPSMTTAIDRASFSEQSDELWRGLCGNGELFSNSPEIFSHSDRLPMKYVATYSQMMFSAVANDLHKEVIRMKHAGST